MGRRERLLADCLAWAFIICIVWAIIGISCL